jgi:hypothetical protein
MTFTNSVPYAVKTSIIAADPVKIKCTVAYEIKAVAYELYAPRTADNLRVILQEILVPVKPVPMQPKSLRLALDSPVVDTQLVSNTVQMPEVYGPRQLQLPKEYQPVTNSNEFNYVINTTFSKEVIPNCKPPLYDKKDDTPESEAKFDRSKVILTNRLYNTKQLVQSDTHIYFIIDSRYKYYEDVLSDVANLLLFGNSIKIFDISTRTTRLVPLPSVEAIQNKRMQHAMYLGGKYKYIKDEYFRNIYLYMVKHKMTANNNTDDFYTAKSLIESVIMELQQKQKELEQVLELRKPTPKVDKLTTMNLLDAFTSSLRARDISVPTHETVDYHKQYSHLTGRVYVTDTSYSYTNKLFSTSSDLETMALYSSYCKKNGMLEMTRDEMEARFNVLTEQGLTNTDEYLELSFKLNIFNSDLIGEKLGCQPFKVVEAKLESLESRAHMLHCKVIRLEDRFNDRWDALNLVWKPNISEDDVLATNDALLIAQYNAMMDAKTALYTAKKSYRL